MSEDAAQTAVRRLAEADDLTAMQEVSRDPLEEKARILVVDDDERNLAAINMMLGGLGEELILVKSGAEALRYLLHHDCALILLDVRMPIMDGYETADLIRGRDRSKHIPIIFLTAADRDQVQEFRGYTAGAVDYVFKPFDPFILKAKVAVFVELYKKTLEIRAKAEHERRLLAENFRVNTEKLLAEQALRRSEERQDLILKSLPISLYSVTATAPLESPIFISDNIQALCGFPATQFRDIHGFWSGRIHPDDIGKVRSEFTRLPETESCVIEYRWQCADGSYRHFLNQAVLLREDNGAPREIVGSWLDVTERRNIEHQLVHAQKMDALGRLTGGIAHDFNNMLTVVIGSLDRLRRTIGDDRKASSRIQLAMQGAIRCADLTRRLLSFARQHRLDARPVDLNDLVVRVEGIVRRIIGEIIDLEVHCADNIWTIQVDPVLLESSLVNLVVNARDAMPEGGRLTIATANVVVAEDDALQCRSGDYVRLSVTDTGIGIAPEVIDKVFEPFFTTKEVGKGTGLGLSIIYGFVRQSGGDVRLLSESGKGTTVEIYLPRAVGHDTVAGVLATEEGDSPEAIAGEVVLVVEDDEDVRYATVTLLEELGYEVLEAADADQALATLRAGGRIDLMFSDIVMPGPLNGYQLAQQATLVRPNLRIVLTSAYPSDGKGSAWTLLPKPYRNHELAHILRAALSR